MNKQQERSLASADVNDGRPGQNDRATAQHVSDHLANERTFLAWIRTALAIIGLGFVAAKFGLYLRLLAANQGSALHSTGTSPALGVALVGFGAAIVLLALGRYLINRRLIEQGAYRPSPWIDVVIAVVVAGGAIVMMVFLLTSTQ